MDKEKVIKGLEHCIKTSCENCPYNATDVNNSNPICLINEMLSDALALLKEQETANLYKCPNCGTWVSAENVVQCKDCEWWDKGCTEECDNSDSVCFRNGRCEPHFYCGDGEKSESV